ncbi:MAG: oligopeptidase B, partial [Planctomycetota bacterium]
MPTPPKAKRVDVESEIHGDVRVDPYQWLQNREDPEVISYLEAENAYTEELTKPQIDLREELYKEMVARIVEDDETVPVFRDGFSYYSRTIRGKQYRVFCRKRSTPDADEEVILDGNVESEGLDFFRLGAMRPSPDHCQLAYTVDVDGSEQFELRVKDLASGDLAEDRVPRIAPSFEWAEDGETLYYVVLDEAMRPFSIRRHRLGTELSEDEEVFSEPDERFFVRIRKTRCRRFLQISVESKVTTEVRLVDARDPKATPRLVTERENGHEYYVEPSGDSLLILSN